MDEGVRNSGSEDRGFEEDELPGPSSPVVEVGVPRDIAGDGVDGEGGLPSGRDRVDSDDGLTGEVVRVKRKRPLSERHFRQRLATGVLVAAGALIALLLVGNAAGWLDAEVVGQYFTALLGVATFVLGYFFRGGRQ